MRLEGCKELYKTFQKLEAKHRDRIWSRIIKNSFAPLFAGRFDYVIGNPPWIRWDNLPQPYREITIEVWKKYGLLKQTTGAGLGKIKKDIAMLFVTVAVDRYLHPNGVLGFLLPFTIFKNQAGAGFRAFLYNKTNVRLIHDMVELMPFEDSINRTSMIILKQGTSNFPLNSTTWRKKSSGSMSNLSLKVDRYVIEIFNRIIYDNNMIVVDNITIAVNS